MNDEYKEFEFVMKGLCTINRISVIINKVMAQEELTKNEEKIVNEIIKIKGLDGE